MTFEQTDLDDLQTAKYLLEHPGLTARMADVIGKPIDMGFKYLPKNWKEKIEEVTKASLLKGLEYAVMTMGDNRKQESKEWLHKVIVTASGVAGGAFGFAALPIELPVSTCIILRSVADIARSEGHDITRLDIKLSCIEVLALGGKSNKDDAAESGYWTVRAALAKAVSEATSYIAERGLAEKGAPPLVKLIGTVASRFGGVVSEEVAAKSVPIVGAVAGGAINYLFMDHFQDMARGHFTIKRLEGKYGSEVVKQKYAESAF